MECVCADTSRVLARQHPEHTGTETDTHTWMVGGRTRRATMDPLLQEDIPDDPVHRQCNNNNDNKNNRFLYNNVILFLIRSKGVPKITCRERARPSYGPLWLHEGSMRTPIRIATVLWRMKWYNNGHLFKAFTDTHTDRYSYDIIVVVILYICKCILEWSPPGIWFGDYAAGSHQCFDTHHTHVRYGC